MSEARLVRVCLADDQTLVRLGLRSLLALAPGVEVVCEASDGLEVLAAVAATPPDVLLLDLRMPRLDGLGVLERLGREGRLPPTLILTTFDDDEALLAGLRAGAKGYLLKDVSLDDLVSAIFALADGKSYVQPAVTERLVRRLAGERPPGPALEPAPSLTERETEVLRLMAGGYSNREVADGLGVSEGTVKNHVSSILSKLEARDRTRAVLKALEMGLI